VHTRLRTEADDFGRKSNTHPVEIANHPDLALFLWTGLRHVILNDVLRLVDADFFQSLVAANAELNVELRQRVQKNIVNTTVHVSLELRNNGVDMLHKNTFPNRKKPSG